MKINLNKNTNNINFKSFGGVTKNPKHNNNNKLDECIHESHFMRNLESLDFTAQYITKNFPNGAHIADFGCSNGEETYSLATLLHESNKDKKYKITGYDIIPEVIENAKAGLISVGYRERVKGKIEEDKYEKFLIDFLTKITPEQMSAKKAFKECFEEIPEKWWYFNIYNPRYKHKVKQIIKPGEDIELTTKRLECLLKPSDYRAIGRKTVIPKRGVFDNILNFNLADVGKIDEVLSKKATNVVIFKNALYHLLGCGHLKNAPKDYKYEDISITPAEELFKKINAVLPENGLFVIGNLSTDHLSRFSATPLEQISQNGQIIDVYKSSRIHKALFEAGFEPIFYECMKSGGADFIELKTHLPSVWKKIKTII